MHPRGGKSAVGSSPTAAGRRRDVAECTLAPRDAQAWATGRAPGDAFEIPVGDPALGWPISIVTAE